MNEVRPILRDSVEDVNKVWFAESFFPYVSFASILNYDVDGILMLSKFTLHMLNRSEVERKQTF